MALLGESLCKHIFNPAFDLFGKNLIENDIFSEKSIDKDKLRNVIGCEKKRLHRFASEFPHEQHLMNLQSLLVTALINLARITSDQTSSINQLRIELHRIAVLVQEIDCELAKAKQRKRAELFNHIIRQHQEADAITLAAEKAKSDQKVHKVIGAIIRDAQNSELAEKAAEHAKQVKEKASQVFERLQQYRLHVMRQAVDARVRARMAPFIKYKVQLAIERELRNMVNNMELDCRTRESVVVEALKLYKEKLTPFSIRPALRVV